MPPANPLRAQNLKVVETSSTESPPKQVQVLLVGDDATILEAARSILDGAGFLAVVSDDPRAAVEKSKDPAIDVILLDFDMLDVSSLELLRGIKAQRPEVEVVMMAARTHDGASVAAALKAGVFDFIVKPLKADHLCPTVERAAERKALLDDKRRLEASRMGHRASQEPKVEEGRPLTEFRPSIHVLAIDDEPDNLEYLRIFLQREGCVVSSADDPREGLEKAMDPTIDVILLDLLMPYLNGQEVLPAIKAVRPEVEVVIITAYGTLDAALKTMKAGAFDFIRKPSLPEAMSLVVARAAAHKRFRDSQRNAERTGP